MKLELNPKDILIVLSAQIFLSTLFLFLLQR